MTPHQRQSLIDLMNAILACACAPADIRFRANNLLWKLQMDQIRFDRFFGGVA